MSQEISTSDGGLLECKKVYTVIENSEKFESAMSRFQIKLTSFDISLTVKSDMVFASAEEFAAVALFLNKETINTLSEQELTQWLKSNLPEGTSIVRYEVSRKPKVTFIPTTSTMLEKDKLVYDSFLAMMEDIGIL